AKSQSQIPRLGRMIEGKNLRGTVGVLLLRFGRRGDRTFAQNDKRDSGEKLRAKGEERPANNESEGLMNSNHCRHIKEDGFFCQGAPLRGREYCRFHLRALGRRIRMARERARREPHRLVLPILEDMNAVHVALMQVLDAVAADQLDDKRAGLLLYGLQQASTNLRSLTAAPCLVVPADEQREGRAEEDPG